MAKFEELNGVTIFREDDEENQGVFWDTVRRQFTDPNELPVLVKGERVLSTGTFSNKEILAAIALGQIVQYPFNPSLIGKASVDIQVGHNFYATDKATKTAGLFNPYDEEDIKRYFGEPFEAAPLREQGELRRKLGVGALNKIDPEHPLVVLRPGERVLGHTHEFMGILPPGMANVYATSSKGRVGITVAQDATFINPGWINRLVLEIKNENEDEYTPLLVGDKAAQITYHSTGPVAGTYSGEYQHADATNIDEIVRTWRREHMLPAAKKVTLPADISGLSGGLR